MDQNLLILNTMSRNGNSLIFQLLYDHPKICFFPARIKIACADPVGWPFIDFVDQNIEQFFNQIIKKTTIPHNLNHDTEWHNIKIELIENINSKIFGNIKLNFLNRTKKYGEIVNRSNLKIFINLYIESVISSLSEKNNYNFYKSKYTLILDDHAYNLGTEDFKLIYADAHFLQIVRNSKDILASRKNMLLFHNKFFGDPSTKKLKDKVLISELRRTIWNFVAAYLNYNQNKNKYHLIKFENLRGHERKKIMTELSSKLKINYTNSLLNETKERNTFYGNELLFADSSLKKISGGRSSKKINSYKVTLNDSENRVIDTFIKKFSGYFPENLNHDDLIPELKSYYENNLDNVMRDKVLSNFFKLYKEARYKELFIEYSKLNYGGSRANNSFE